MAGPGVGQTVGTNADVATSTAQLTAAGLEDLRSQRAADASKIKELFSPPNSDGLTAANIVAKDNEFSIAHTRLLTLIADFTKNELMAKGMISEEDSSAGTAVGGTDTGSPV